MHKLKVCLMALLALSMLAMPASARVRHVYKDWHNGGGWHNNWRPRPYHHGPDVGDVVGGIIIGNAIGNWLFPPKVVPPQELVPWTPGWMDACTRRYRSFDPKSGYYMGYDGVTHFCRIAG